MNAKQGISRHPFTVRHLVAVLAATPPVIAVLALSLAACQGALQPFWRAPPTTIRPIDVAKGTADSFDRSQTTPALPGMTSPPGIESHPALLATPEETETQPLKTDSAGIGAMAQSWERLDTTGGGGQTGIATHPADPNIVYMASDNGGLFKTENGGDNWFSVSSNLGAYRLGSVTLDPLNPDVIYVTASTDFGGYAAGDIRGELYRSRDGGTVWELLSDQMGFKSSFPNQAAIVIPYDPAHPNRFDQDDDHLSDLIVVGSWSDPTSPPAGGVWRSSDSGRTFAQIALSDRNVTAIRAFEKDLNVLFLTTDQGQIYKSQDLGETWTDITSNLSLPHLADVAIHPDDQDTLYVTCRECIPGKAPVWRTQNGGRRWRKASRGLNSTKSTTFPRILIDRSDPDILYVTTFQSQRGVYRGTRTRIIGIRWRPMPAMLTLPDGRPYHSRRFHGGLIIAQAVDGRLFAGGGGAWRYPAGSPSSTNTSVGHPKIWEPATIGIGNIRVNTIHADPSDASVLYQGTADRGPYKSVDSGSSFHRILGTGWPVTVENFRPPGPYYSNYDTCQIPCSATCTKGGQIAAGSTTDFAISRQNPTTVYSSFGSGSNRSLRGGVNKSTDGGSTWQPVGFQLEKGFELNPETCLPYGFRRLAIDPTDEDVVLAAMENPVSWTTTLYRTTDGGTTWSEVFDTPGVVTGLEISGADPDLVVLTTQTDMFRSERRGAVNSFHSITPPEISQIRAIALSPHRAEVYVIGTRNDGIYYTADGGRSWLNNQLEAFFEQRIAQDSTVYLDAQIATALNPNVRARRHISAITFDPVVEDVFYVGANLRPHAGFGVARVTDAGQKWERLPLTGLTHRNIFDLEVDSEGRFLYAGTFDGTFKFELGY